MSVSPSHFGITSFAFPVVAEGAPSFVPLALPPRRIFHTVRHDRMVPRPVVTHSINLTQVVLVNHPRVVR